MARPFVTNMMARVESIKSILLPRVQNEEWVQFFLMLLLTSAASHNVSDLGQIM